MKIILITAFIVSFSIFICLGVDNYQFEGKSIDAWAKTLIGLPEQPYGPPPTIEMQQQAVAVFRKMGKPEYFFLVDQLITTNAIVGWIPYAFKAAGSNAVPAIPKLIKALDNEIPVSWRVAECLKNIGTNSIPPLIAALDNKKVKIRRGAAYALGQIGSPAEPAIPKLLERLNMDETSVRYDILTALGLINQHPEIVVPALIPYLSNEDPTVRGNASFAMIGFGKDARAAAPKLFQLMSDDNENVRINAGGALEHMETGMGTEFVTLLKENATNSDLKIRKFVLQQLTNRGIKTNSSK